MKLARLSATTRLVCLLGPMVAAGLFVVARVVMPAVWARPGLARIVAQPCMLKSATGATIIVNDTGIYIQNGKGASIVMTGPTVTVNQGALVVV